jgi:hypothetical protein
MAGPPPLPAGQPGAPAQGCSWKIHVKVHSTERFPPKGAFDVVFGEVKPDPAAKPDSLVPPIPSAWYTNNAKMAKKLVTSDLVFSGSGKKSGGVTAKVCKLANEADWVLVAGPKSKAPLPQQYLPESINCGQKHKLDLFVRHPLKLYLELKFKDPEKNVFPFPKDFPVQVWEKKKLVEQKTDEKGRVAFDVNRKYDWVTLKFGNGPVLFSVGDGKAGKCELKTDADRKALTASEAKFFAPPNTWGLVESVWKLSEDPKYIDGAKAYKEDEGKIYLFNAHDKNWVRRVGEKNAPVTLTLDPHWTFARLEYFDRYYGHTHHGHQRVDLPPLLVESVWVKGGKTAVEGRGQWVVSAKSVTDAVHAIPWIRQKLPNGHKSEKPDKQSYLRFKLAPDSYVLADIKTRKIDTIPAGDARLEPGVDRLKYYDLPEGWESRKYWTRLGKGNKQDGKFWEDWTTADLLRSRAVDDPLIFSLDDIVIASPACNPLKMAKDARLTAFYHRFKPAYDQTSPKDVSDHGVIKPDTNEPYFSDIKLKGAKLNYLADYPNWVRLLAGVGSLYDVFDQRTKSGVLGARAAVKWYDPVKSGVPAPKVTDPWPKGVIGFQKAVDKKHFVIEPYFGQEQHIFYRQYPTAGERVGRFDMALVRNCDRLKGDKELFLSMQYFRLFYNFLAASAVKGAAARTSYVKNSVVQLMNRWNGKDAVNASRAEIVPRDNTKKLSGEVLWFVQPAKGLKDAHFRLDISAKVDRAGMGSADGTGEIGDNEGTAAPSYGTANAFVLAHELGHGGSLNDEYAERINYTSEGVAGFSTNTPGDPFVDEGLYPELNATVYAAGNPPYPMMTQTVEMRNRYFWHNAEFARKYIKEGMFARHGKYEDYQVPPHPNYPRKQYSHWPINYLGNQALGAKGKADLYLLAAGKERYTLDLIPKGPYDGIITVLVKIVLYENTAGPSKVVSVRDAILEVVRDYNKRFYGTGDANVTIDDGKGGSTTKAYTYNKTMFRLSPRFCVAPLYKTAADFAKPADYAKYKLNWPKQVKNTITTFGKHFEVNIIDAKKGASGFDAKTGKYDLVVDYGGPAPKAIVKGWAQEYFREMIGVAYNPKKAMVMKGAELRHVGQAIFAANGDVKDL